MSKISEKGFTLIEILAVITIIGIISLITIPVVNRVIQGTGDKIYKANEKSLAMAAENYYMEKSALLPETIKSKKMIFMDELIESGYIKKIKDLKDRTQYCDGYVIVEKIKEKVYDYKSYLKCADDFITDDYYDQPPVINMLGINPITVAIKSSYVDPGATAMDVKDKNITTNITTVNNVNTLVAGAYTVTYSVTNSSGISMQIVRTVNVSADITPPVITLLGENSITIDYGSLYVDAGATAKDDIDGNITANIIMINDVNTSIAGTYTVTYNVSDSFGNKAKTVIRTVTVKEEPIPAPVEFAYTGSIQTYTILKTGKYKLEVWGAQGGHAGYSGSILTSGGKGGYATGQTQLTVGQTIYIYVGGQGTSGNNTSTSNQVNGGYNGGGYGYNGNSSSNRGAGGGGASDIRIGGTALSNRVIVAGAGAGGVYYSSYGTNYPGYGGGTSGANGYTSNYDSSYSYHGKGGTQSAGGTGGSNGSTGSAGSLGLGGNGGHAYGYGESGGGAGYYGGGASGTGMAGGGGSSYVGTLSSTQNIAGNASMPSPTGGTQTGQTGNGYAKITYVP